MKKKYGPVTCSPGLPPSLSGDLVGSAAAQGCGLVGSAPPRAAWVKDLWQLERFHMFPRYINQTQDPC